MISYSTVILKFGRKGEKTGWTYIEVGGDIAERLKPDNKKSFRVKGSLDKWKFSGIALIPMGDGNFIMALNKTVRNAIGKKAGAMVKVTIEADEKEPVVNADLLDCLKEENKALIFFNSLAKSHQLYFSKWIESARTDDTKAKRIVKTVNALSRKMGFGEMLREGKGKI